MTKTFCERLLASSLVVCESNIHFLLLINCCLLKTLTIVDKSVHFFYVKGNLVSVVIKILCSHTKSTYVIRILQYWDHDIVSESFQPDM